MIQVVLGEHSIYEEDGFEQKFNVSLVVKHYQYKDWKFDSDIMLIKVRDQCIFIHVDLLLILFTDGMKVQPI